MFIESIELAAVDLESLRAFYADKLGLAAELFEGVLTLTAGDSSIIFRRQNTPPGPYHFAFNIPENRIDDALSWLESCGISPIPDASENPTHEFLSWNADAVYFLDPAGNVVELIARHELSNSVESEAPFTTSEILNVSEIGIATTNVIGMADRLVNEYGLSQYREADESFAPIGDAIGLFIVVPIGRTWYPTKDSTASQGPLKVNFRSGESEYAIEAGS